MLNINNNNIDDIKGLAVLKELHDFSAADNKLQSLEASISIYLRLS